MFFDSAPATTTVAFRNRAHALIRVLEYTPTGPTPNAYRPLTRADTNDLEVRGAKDGERFTAHCEGCLADYFDDKPAPDIHHLSVVDGTAVNAAHFKPVRGWAQRHADQCSALPATDIPPEP